MASFKGGFAFNNEAAKVEVEQAPDGTLISCVNPVTGESLGGGGGRNYKQVITGTLGNPFGDYTPVSIGRAIYNGGLSGIIDIDASALGVTNPIIMPLSFAANDPTDIEGSIYGVMASSAEFQSRQGQPIGILNAAQLLWLTSNEFSGYMDGQYFNLPSTLPTTVTLYWHPMP